MANRYFWSPIIIITDWPHSQYCKFRTSRYITPTARTFIFFSIYLFFYLWFVSIFFVYLFLDRKVTFRGCSNGRRKRLEFRFRIRPLCCVSRRSMINRADLRADTKIDRARDFAFRFLRATKQTRGHSCPWEFGMGFGRTWDIDLPASSTGAFRFRIEEAFFYFLFFFFRYQDSDPNQLRHQTFLNII